MDGAQVLSDMSGISRAEVLSIWEQVKANRAKLDGCARHRFEGVRQVKLGSKHVCLVCGGEMGLTSIGDYIKGYEAHGGSVDDIWPGYRASAEAGA